MADVVVIGFVVDLTETAAELQVAIQKNPGLRIAVVSEEPLWDTVWGGSFELDVVQVSCHSMVFSIHQLNHITSSIFRFEHIPYFITTSDDYLARYRLLMQRKLHDSPSTKCAEWNRAQVDAAFFVEKRDGQEFRLQKPDLSVYGLSEFRTRVAEQCNEMGGRVACVGKGWASQAPRQALPDWHLDKLESLHDNCKVLSALENTHCPDYITEKIFDAFAVGAVPLYCAAPGQGVERLLCLSGLMNVWGMEPLDVANWVHSFQATPKFAEAYLYSLSQLYSILSNAELLAQERIGVANRIESALFGVMSSH